MFEAKTNSYFDSAQNYCQELKKNPVKHILFALIWHRIAFPAKLYRPRLLESDSPRRGIPYPSNRYARDAPNRDAMGNVTLMKERVFTRRSGHSTLI